MAGLESFWDCESHLGGVVSTTWKSISAVALMLLIESFDQMRQATVPMKLSVSMVKVELYVLLETAGRGSSW